MNNINKRESNIEVLRCVAMIMIVFCHLRVHGFKILSYDNEPSLNILILKSFNWLGTIGNFIFMLITGYFISQNSSKPKKILKLWGQIFFYSVILGSISFLCHLETSSLNSGYVLSKMTLFDYLRCFFPFLSCHNWYASAYILFLLFVPFLCQFEETLARDVHKKLCIILIIVGGFIPNLYGFSAGFTPSCIYAFVMMFFIAKYIKKYNPRIFSDAKKDLIIGFGLCFIFSLYVIIVCELTSKLGISIKMAQS